MNLYNTKAQMKKGVLEYCILLVVAKGDIYASEIIANLKAAEIIVVEGTLYPLLTRLKNEGLLSYRWEESKSGPPRKYYNITEDGKTFLEGLITSWNSLVSAVQNLSDQNSNINS